MMPIRRNRPPPSAATPNQRGFALLIVLIGVALLGAMTMRLAAAGRTDIMLTRNLLAAAAAEQAADGAVHEAGVHLAAHTRGWIADGRTIRLDQGNLRIDVTLIDPRGLVNPNLAPAPLMEALIHRVGGDKDRAAHLAAAIFDWRTPGPAPSQGGAKAAQYRAAGLPYVPAGHRFGDVDELGAVLGMSPVLLDALRPHLSVYNFGNILPQRADPIVRDALTQAEIGQPADDDPGPVAIVVARASLPNGARFTRKAALLLVPAANGRPFRILSWENGGA